MTVGRLLERLIGLSAQSGRLRGEPARWASAAGMELLLELFDSAITFRARYQRHEDLLALTDLLVLDSANPRSLGRRAAPAAHRAAASCPARNDFTAARCCDRLPAERRRS